MQLRASKRHWHWLGVLHVRLSQRFGPPQPRETAPPLPLQAYDNDALGVRAASHSRQILPRPTLEALA